MEGTESKVVGRGCSVVTSVGLRGVDGVLFVEGDPVRNDGVDAHRARGVSLFRPRQQQQQRPIMRDRSGTSPRLCLCARQKVISGVRVKCDSCTDARRAVNRNNARASNRAMSPKQNRIGRLNTSTI